MKVVRQSSVRSPLKSIAYRHMELGVPETTIQNVLQMCLRLHAYKIQLRYEVKSHSSSKVCCEIDDTIGYLQQVMFMTNLPFTSMVALVITTAEFWDYDNCMNSLSMDMIHQM